MTLHEAVVVGRLQLYTSLVVHTETNRGAADGGTVSRDAEFC